MWRNRLGLFPVCEWVSCRFCFLVRFKASQPSHPSLLGQVLLLGFYDSPFGESVLSFL